MMNAFRVLRKIHKPIFFVFLCALCLLGLVETTVFDSNTNTTPMPPRNVQLDIQTMTSPTPTSSGAVGDDILIVTAHEDYDLGQDGLPPDNNFEELPIPPKQLPFCNHGKSTKSTIDGEHQSLGEDTDRKAGRNETTDEIFLANANGLRKGKQILVATLDGKLSLLDHDGKLVWTLCTGHFFSSTISTIQLGDNGKLVKLIPSLTGGLYKYDGDSLQAMPLSAESLLKRSFKLSNDVVITGGKELKTFGIDVKTGDLKYECGMDGCQAPTKAELKADDETNQVVLVVKKQLQTVRAIESLTGSERWNFSVASHEIAIAGLTEGCYEPAEDGFDYENTNSLLKMLISEGIIFGADAENHAIWQHKFESPISQAWTLENGRLNVVDPIKTAPLVDDIPSLYVGIHKQQLYVQESHSAALKVRTKLELEFASRDTVDIHQKTIEWKPSNGKFSVAGAEDKDSTALTPFYGRPFFVYDRDEVGYSTTPIPAIEAPPGYGFRNPLLDEQDDEDDTLIILGLSTLWFWWKEVLGISLLTAVVLNILLLRPMIRFVRRQTVQEMTRFFGNLMNREQQDRDRQALLPRTSTNEELMLTERPRTVSTSSNNSQSPSTEDQIAAFSSQYLKEFEPIQCLGRGGFGVVFEARKKIDDRTYAVKRIALPNSEKSRDRVMREVKALAKLDHKHIVRYFNAWIESPPLGWLEKSDPLWNCGAMTSGATNANESYSYIGSGQGDFSASVFQSGIGRKSDHFEITVPDKTPEGDDSFIVFSANSIEEVDDDDNEILPSSHQTRSVSVSIENGTESTNLLSISEEYSNSYDKGSPGKFFARPTTLNIPSSNDSNSWAKDTDEKNSSTEGPGSPTLSVMYLYIQQELCQKRTLQEWLRAEKERNHRHVVRIFAQIVEAVEYIHSHNLIHRDLKPSNIFLAGESGKDEHMTAKIGDFGLATTLVPSKLNEEPKPSPDGEVPPTTADSGDMKLTGHVGTHLYMSPEQNQQKPYDYKVDIYSLGLIFFELLVPFSTEMERYDFISRIRKLNFPKVFSESHPEEYKLIKKMVDHRPDRRPDTSEVKLWLSERIHALQFTEPSTITTHANLRSKSFPSSIITDDRNYQNDEKLQYVKHFHRAHSFQL